MSELIARPWEWSREQGGDIVIHGPRYPDGGSTADIVLSDGAYLSEEEAALIVKAVNSHDKLVGALKDMTTIVGEGLIDDVLDSRKDIEARWELACTAIKEAKG